MRRDMGKVQSKLFTQNRCLILNLARVTLSLKRVINVKFPLQLHQKYYITQYGELGFSLLTQMKDAHTINSHYLT